MSSADLAPGVPFTLLSVPTPSVGGNAEIWPLGRSDMVNGFRPYFRDLVLLRLVLEGNVVTARGGVALEVDVLKNDLVTTTLSVSRDLGATGWFRVEDASRHVIRSLNDPSPEWIGVRQRTTAGSVSVLDVSFTVEAMYLE